MTMSAMVTAGVEGVVDTFAIDTQTPLERFGGE